MEETRRKLKEGRILKVIKTIMEKTRRKLNEGRILKVI